MSDGVRRCGVALLRVSVKACRIQQQVGCFCSGKPTVCGVPDRDSNEVRYLQVALDMIEDFQRRGARREVAEIILVERQ